MNSTKTESEKVLLQELNSGSASCLFSDLELLSSRTHYLPPSVGFQTKMPSKQEVLRDWTQEGPWGYKWIWHLLQVDLVQKEVQFLGKKVNLKKKGTIPGLRSIRHKQPLEEEPVQESKRSRVIQESFLSWSQGNHRWYGKTSLKSLISTPSPPNTFSSFPNGRNDWFEFHSFCNKDSRVVGEPWTWVRNLRAESCCDYVSEPSCVTLRKCPNIQGSRFPHLKSQVSVRFHEVMNVKAYVTYYRNNMIFFTTILRELTNMNINKKVLNTVSFPCKTYRAYLTLIAKNASLLVFTINVLLS